MAKERLGIQFVLEYLHFWFVEQGPTAEVDARTRHLGWVLPLPFSYRSEMNVQILFSAVRTDCGVQNSAAMARIASGTCQA